jgi:NADH dehydrogenase
MGDVVTVFGGTGFLGRRVVRHLRDKGFSVRIASRHPSSSRDDDPHVRLIGADIRERRSVETAVVGAFGVVNAVSLYVERGTDTFQALHVAAAERVAEQARKAGVERLIQISGIGADAASPSPYIRARGQGEQAVRQAGAGAAIVRPAVMFGPDDAFLNTLVQLLRWLPVYPMFGRGETRLQPVNVEDVGEAVARLMQRTGRQAITVECGGPRVYAYEELLRTIARAANVKRVLVPVPFAAWHALARVAEMLPGAPITRNQVELMAIDTVASADVPGFADLGISPAAMEQILPGILARN